MPAKLRQDYPKEIDVMVDNEEYQNRLALSSNNRTIEDILANKGNRQKKIKALAAKLFKASQPDDLKLYPKKGEAK